MSLGTALVSVDVVPFQVHNQVLQVLTQRQILKSGAKGLVLPSGRIDPQQDLSLNDTAQRLLEQAALTPASYYEQVTTIGNAQRDSRGWSVTVVYYALLNRASISHPAETTEWINVIEGCPERKLAYDHNSLVKEALERLRNKIQYSSLPVYLLPEEFTLSDIQNVFAVLLGKAPPMRSIRNRFLRGEVLQETGTYRRGNCRPAALYRANQQSEAFHFDRLYLSTQASA